MYEMNKPDFKWYCRCITAQGETVFLVATAYSEVEASRKIHANYAVAYVEDIYTPYEMNCQKHYMRPTFIGVAQFMPWWTSPSKGGPRNGRAIQSKSIS